MIAFIFLDNMHVSKWPDYSRADFIIRKAFKSSQYMTFASLPFLFNPKFQSSSTEEGKKKTKKNICLGNEKCTFFGKREKKSGGIL